MKYPRMDIKRKSNVRTYNLNIVPDMVIKRHSRKRNKNGKQKNLQHSNILSRLNLTDSKQDVKIWKNRKPINIFYEKGDYDKIKRQWKKHLEQ